MAYDFSPHVISHPRAQEANELFLVEIDLKHVIGCCDARDRLNLAALDSFVLSRALATSALITYRRCFTSGARVWLTQDDLQSLKPASQDKHRHLYEWANKAYAHSVAANENSVLSVSMGRSKDGDLKRGGFQYGANQAFDLGGSIGSDLRELCKEVAREVVAPRKKCIEEELQTWLATFTDEEVASWPCGLDANLPAEDRSRARRKLNKPGSK
jgi:hypothetical protein